MLQAKEMVTMKTRILSALLCAVLFAGLLTPAAFASEEFSVEAPAAEASPEVTQEPAAEAEEPAAEPEAPAEESEELEITVEWEQDSAIPEDGDPLALRLGLYGTGVPAAYAAGGVTHANFTTRALNNEILHKGIDVSAYQKNIQWDQVAAAGIDFAIIRAAYRGYEYGTLATDGYFTKNIKGAKAAGLKVGVYIFSQAITVAEAREEADYLMSLVKSYDVDLPLVIDFEHVSTGRLVNANLSKRAATDICNAFCARVEAGGYDSMVYANPNMLNNYLYPSELGRLWLAHYATQTSYSARGYEYWQCSQYGSVAGIVGDVDLDFWFEPIKETPPAPLPFTDVPIGAWYYEAVMAAYEAGIVAGMTKDTFAPGGTATRAQVVAMIHRMAGEPAAKTVAGFEDLTQDYYKAAVNWAAEEGIVSGFSEKKFAPNNAITREQLVAILYRIEGEPETESTLEGYTDADSVQSWARDAMAWATEQGVVSGYGDATLRPQNKATRAEVCSFLIRYALLEE